MSTESGHSSESEPRVEVEVLDPATKWEMLREDVLNLEQLCFGDRGFTETDLREHFENPENVVVVLNRNGRIIGFTSAVPDEKVEGALYIDTTDILPQEQGKRHVITLMNALEAEARKRGYKFITRNAAVENGYADKIQRSYGERIVDTHENDSEWGPQRYFRIAL